MIAAVWESPPRESPRIPIRALRTASSGRRFFVLVAPLCSLPSADRTAFIRDSYSHAYTVKSCQLG